MRFLFAITLSIFISAAHGAYDHVEGINTQKCMELCNNCGGIGSYVDQSCECYVGETDEDGECFDRMKRKARQQFNFDLINCKRGLSDRPSRCNYQNSRRIGSYDICRIAQYFLSGGPAKRIPIVKSKCDCDPITTTTTTSTEPTIIKTFIDNCEEIPDECNPTTERPIEDPCEEYKPTPRPPTYLERHYDYPKPTFLIHNPGHRNTHPILQSSVPTSNNLFSNYLNHGNNYNYPAQFPAFPTRQTLSPYDLNKNKYMEDMQKAMMERNYYNSMMESQAYKNNKMNSYNYNTFPTNGYMNSLYPNNYNYMQSLYSNGNVNNNYQIDSYLQSLSYNDLFQLQKFLANQNSMLQRLQSSAQADNNYMPLNMMVGAANPSSTDNTMNQENTTPQVLTTLGSSNDETVVSSAEGNDNTVIVIDESQTMQGGGDDNSNDSTERSRRVVRPTFNRRLMKRGFKSL
ncbi:GATA zinc finger domain-containing protein 4-like isoform X1 [Microplitis mediator]|uniref:GATA zinc finger domain-containing protein 4-like isoform X1 n=2 Tax=Microplitis mediator TaxID=375433 RepID=UPI002553A82C|nr:GATA zinc finger domain-containing protein 4-like isoform X1 [Microplitis mediator]